MIITTGNLNSVKVKIKELYGHNVFVKVNLGRNKFARFNGKVTGIYPALFTVSPLEDFRGKTTYSYSEVLCGNVFLKENDG
ncbi:MAG: Veg family protein [Clostridia bacterium]|nr:Veg family protein [Clostridia bacterium]